MDTYNGGSMKHRMPHIIDEPPSTDCTTATLLSHDPHNHRHPYDPWFYRSDSCSQLSQPDTLLSFLHHQAPRAPSEIFTGDIYSSPITINPPLPPSSCDCAQHLMNSDSCPEHSPPSFNGLLVAGHESFYRPQPPSPPLDTPELVQRSLPRLREHPPGISSSLDSLGLSPLSSEPANTDLASSPLGSRPHPDAHENHSSTSCKRQRRWNESDSEGFDVHTAGFVDAGFDDNPRLSPLELLSPELPMTTRPTSADIFKSPCTSLSEHHDEHIAWEEGLARFGSSDGFICRLYGGAQQKARGRSLDSARLEDFTFGAPKTCSVYQPLRARTTLLKPEKELQPQWGSAHQMDVDSVSPPQPESLLLPLQGLDSELKSGGMLDNEDSQVNNLPDLFNEPSCGGFSPVYELPDLEMDDIPSAPSSPHSPLMQLAPDPSDDMFEVSSDGTISPSLLGPPPNDGLGLFIEPSGVDPPFARSPSPSDYELQILEGQVDISSSGLPEDEYQTLRTYYESVQQAEAAARERENALDRRVKDISALLDPFKVVSDPAIMYTRRQELRTASEMRTEARRARKREKHRLREIGAILDLKMDLNRAIFQGRSTMRNMPQLVANMVLKRRDTTRSLANRRTAGTGKAISSSLRTITTLTVNDGDDPIADVEIGIE